MTDSEFIKELEKEIDFLLTQLDFALGKASLSPDYYLQNITDLIRHYKISKLK